MYTPLLFICTHFFVSFTPRGGPYRLKEKYNYLNHTHAIAPACVRKKKVSYTKKVLNIVFYETINFYILVVTYKTGSTFVGVYAMCPSHTHALVGVPNSLKKHEKQKLPPISGTKQIKRHSHTKIIK